MLDYIAKISKLPKINDEEPNLKFTDDDFQPIKESLGIYHGILEL